MVENLLLVLLSVTICKAQFPKDCVEYYSLKDKVCCPKGRDGSMCNNATLKGFCVPHTQFQYYHHENLDKDMQIASMDDRGHWPSRFFDNICMCQGNFFGPDCGRCAYGYWGEKCDRMKTPVVRRNALTLTKEERKQFVDTIARAKREIDPDYVIVTRFAKDVRHDLRKARSWDGVKKILNGSFRNQSYWDIISWLHYYTARSTIDQSKHIKQRKAIDSSLINFGHSGSAFAPWHRYFLLLVEERLQKVSKDPTFTIPYWDWTQDSEKNQCSVCTDDLAGALDYAEIKKPAYIWKENKGRVSRSPARMLSRNSPFREWRVVCGNTHFTPGALRADGYNAKGTLCQGNTTDDEYLTRGIRWGRDGEQLPNAEEVMALLNIPEYDRIDRNSLDPREPDAYQSFNKYTRDSFRNSLEGYMGSMNPKMPGRYMHNLVHMWIGGVMTNTPIAANDPLFFLHHCNIDRIFEAWLQKHAKTAHYDCLRFGVKDKSNQPSGCPIGHDTREFMAPFFPLKTPYQAFKPSLEFGYQYDQLAGGSLRVLFVLPDCLRALNFEITLKLKRGKQRITLKLKRGEQRIRDAAVVIVCVGGTSVPK